MGENNAFCKLLFGLLPEQNNPKTYWRSLGKGISHDHEEFLWLPLAVTLDKMVMQKQRGPDELRTSGEAFTGEVILCMEFNF